MAAEPFPFATVGELKDRWPDFPPGADAHATVLLEDASQFILDVCPSAEAAAPATRRRVVCAVVRRSMQAGDDAGFESVQTTTGPFTESVRPTNPNGDFYLTKQEKKALGAGATRAFGVQVAEWSAAQHRPWCALYFGAAYCSCGADIAGEPIYEGA